MDEITRLRLKVRGLEEDNRRLTQAMQHLQPEPENDSYPLDQFQLALMLKLGRTYGWKVDYADATQITPGSQKVNTDDIQRWQKERRVPVWAYTQIAWLMFPNRVGRAKSKPQWIDTEVDYLLDMCRANPTEANATLAERCSVRFNREIVESAIKGKKYRLIKEGLLPECDPAREREH